MPYLVVVNTSPMKDYHNFLACNYRNKWVAHPAPTNGYRNPVAFFMPYLVVVNTSPMKGYHNLMLILRKPLRVVNTSPMKGYHNLFKTMEIQKYVVNTSPMKGYHNRGLVHLNFLVLLIPLQ